MASDAEWVEDVKRWYLAGVRSGLPGTSPAEGTDFDALGYEAAHPALQARHWPDVSVTGFGDSR